MGRIVVKSKNRVARNLETLKINPFLILAFPFFGNCFGKIIEQGKSLKRLKIDK